MITKKQDTLDETVCPTLIMLILGNKKDYYDSAVGMGIDKTIVYDRQLNEMLVPNDIKEKISESIKWHKNFTWVCSGWKIKRIPIGKNNTEIIVIGFCGKLYVGIKITTQTIDEPYDFNVDFVYNHDRILEMLKDKQNHKDHNKKYGENYVKNFENYLLRIKSIDPTEWFRRFNSPIFVYGTSKPTTYKSYFNHVNTKVDFFVNPILKEYDFAKVVDPYTAFQEIQMYISGVLGTEKDGDEIKLTEKQKIAQHGMDKWSFRKPPKND